MTVLDRIPLIGLLLLLRKNEDMIAILAIAFSGLMIGACISELHFSINGGKYPAINTKIFLIMVLICVGLVGLSITSYHLGAETGRAEIWQMIGKDG